MNRDDDDPPTPPQTPSALHRLGLVPCPKCHAAGSVDGAACDLCNGGRHVGVDHAIAWTVAHGSA